MQSCRENSLKLLKQKPVTVQNWCTGLLPTRPPSLASDPTVENQGVFLLTGEYFSNQQENILLSLHGKSQISACFKTLATKQTKKNWKRLKKAHFDETKFLKSYCTKQAAKTAHLP